MYALLIGTHAVAGAVAFVVGLLALRRDRFLDPYVGLLVVMAAFLVLAIAVTAAGRDAAGLAVPGALVVLAGVMIARAVQARRVRPSRTGARTAAYVNRVGFGLVGLFDAFWVVALLRADLPGVAVAAAGVGIAVAGHLLLGRVGAGRRVAVG